MQNGGGKMINPNANITEIEFRNKEYGWMHYTLVFTYK